MGRPQNILASENPPQISNPKATISRPYKYHTNIIYNDYLIIYHSPQALPLTPFSIQHSKKNHRRSLLSPFQFNFILGPSQFYGRSHIALFPTHHIFLSILRPGNISKSSHFHFTSASSKSFPNYTPHSYQLPYA